MGSAPLNYPGGSKSRVTRAGTAVREGRATPEDLAVINLWREAHRPVLNTFQALLRKRTRGKDVVVAQRHKRKITIFDKLHRFPSMDLARMDDIAGCRLIFNDVAALYNFREGLHKAQVKHKRRNDVDKYDYLKTPKTTGYRGIHDIYEYDVRSNKGAASKGLYVEIQYRTAVQHAWATAVEVVGFITENKPKFSSGDKRYLQAMSLASEILSRAYERMNSCHPELSNIDLLGQFFALDAELGLMDMLHGLTAVKSDFSLKQNVILIFSEDEKLEVRNYRGAPEALRALFLLEKENQDKDVVLVRADTSDSVRVAFRNYFSDAKDFIQLVEDGAVMLRDSP